MKDQRPSRNRDQRSNVSTVHRRRFIAVGGGVGAALLAGCTSSDGPADRDDGGDDPDDGANFRLLVSDAPADIDDFDRLDVTLDSARVFDGGEGDEADDEEETDDEGEQAAEGDENGTSAEDEQADEGPSEDYQQTENMTDEEATETATPTEDETEDEADDGDDETDDGPEDGTGSAGGEATEAEGGDEEGADAEGDEDGDGDGDAERRQGFYVLDLEDATVDLTRVVGDRAVPVFDGELSAGSYRKLELHVADVEGVVDGEPAEVKVPSGKLQITKPFEVRAGEALDFVFDINVVKRGQEESYNLQPVISESGVAGEDVEVEEVDESEARGGREDAGEGDGRAGGEGDDGDETGDEDGQGAGDGGAGGSNGSADSTGETPDED